MPVAAIPGEPAHLDPKNDADVTERDLREQSLKTFPPLQALAADAKIVVNDFNLFARPSKRLRSIDQVVLQPRRFNVFLHLPSAGLTYIDDRYPREMPRSDFAATGKRLRGASTFGTGIRPSGGHASPPLPGETHEPSGFGRRPLALPGASSPESGSTDSLT